MQPDGYYQLSAYATREVEEANEQLRGVITELLRVGCTGTELRLMCVGTNGQAMADPNNENGRAIHARCDAIDAARKKASDLLAK